MSWDKIRGQKIVKKQLSRAYEEGRVAHAYCFWGMDGVGKEATALEFAKLLNCEDLAHNDGLVEACGKCSSCQMAEKLQHPNIELIYPLPTAKKVDNNSDNPLSGFSDDQIESIKQQQEAKSQDAYYKISLEKANQIKISSIRSVKKRLMMSSNYPGYRCVLIFDADKITQEAANAFLKTLEEPHSKIVIIMVTSRKEMLLQTIMSRCQQIRFMPVGESDIEKYMREEYSLSEADAKIAAAFAQGSIRRAKGYMDEAVKSMREMVVELLRSSLKRRLYKIDLMAMLDPIVKGNNREEVELIFNLMIIWFRDVLALKNGSKE